MPDARPFLLGITGNIACGKSLVSSMIGETGAEVIDADLVAHEMMQPGSQTLKEIADTFGDEVLNQDGSLDRPALGAIVFSDPEALTTLEQITHPPTVREILQRANASSANLVVIDAIKLFESGLADHCDQIWAVICDPDIQRQRLMARNNLDQAQAQQRIDAQPPQIEKKKRAHVVIDNSGTIEETRTQVTAALSMIPAT